MGPQKKGWPRVPIVVTILLVIVSIVASVFITRAVMMSKVQKAEVEATVSKDQASALAKRIEELEAQQSAQATDATTANPATTPATTQQGVEDPWLADGALYTSGDSTLDEEVKSYVDARVDTSMTQADAVFEVYKGIAWSDYVERDQAQHPSGTDWRTKFARQYFENSCSGNCYEFAAFLSFCMQYLGYTDATAQGVTIEFEGGNWGDHGIVFVTNTDGSKCICDTARGTNGWMLSEGAYNMEIMDFESA